MAPLRAMQLAVTLRAHFQAADFALPLSRFNFSWTRFCLNIGMQSCPTRLSMSSCFDFVRLRNCFRRRSSGFTHSSEYTQKSEGSLGTRHFFLLREKQFLLLTKDASHSTKGEKPGPGFSVPLEKACFWGGCAGLCRAVVLPIPPPGKRQDSRGWTGSVAVGCLVSCKMNVAGKDL